MCKIQLYADFTLSLRSRKFDFSCCEPCITHNDVAKGWTSTVHRQDKHDFSLIMIEFKLVSTRQDGNQLGSLSYLPRVRIEKRGSEKPINLTEQLFMERSLTVC